MAVPWKVWGGLGFGRKAAPMMAVATSSGAEPPSFWTPADFSG
jgi:hypothetical protein